MLIAFRTIEFDTHLSNTSTQPSMNHSMILYSNCEQSNDVLNVRMALIWTEQLNEVCHRKTLHAKQSFFFVGLLNDATILDYTVLNGSMSSE